jgi:hypothetical protein
MRLVAWTWERGQRDDSPRKEMTETFLTEKTQLERPADALLRSGHMMFSLAIIALGIETFVCAGSLVGTLIQTDRFGKDIRPDPGGLWGGTSIQAHSANGRDGVR